MTQRSTKTNCAPVAREIAGQCVGVQVRMLNRAVSRIYDEHLRPHGIKFSQMNILTVIALHGPVQPIDVARLLSMEKSTLSRNLRVMQHNGWVEAQRGESGNNLLLRLTSAGQRLLTTAAPAWRDAQTTVTCALGERVASSIRGAVGRLKKRDAT